MSNRYHCELQKTAQSIYGEWSAVIWFIGPLDRAFRHISLRVVQVLSIAARNQYSPHATSFPSPVFHLICFDIKHIRWHLMLTMSIAVFPFLSVCNYVKCILLNLFFISPGSRRYGQMPRSGKFRFVHVFHIRNTSWHWLSWCGCSRAVGLSTVRSKY